MQSELYLSKALFTLDDHSQKLVNSSLPSQPAFYFLFPPGPYPRLSAAGAGLPAAAIMGRSREEVGVGISREGLMASPILPEENSHRLDLRRVLCT